MKYDITARRLIELTKTIKGEHPFPKATLLLLLLWKEEGDNAIDYFLSINPTYLKLLDNMEKENLLIKGKINVENSTVSAFLSNIIIMNNRTDAKELLNVYNTLWAGKMGCGSSGNRYILLEIQKNREEFLLFLERNPEITAEDIKAAVNSYFTTLKKRNDAYEYALKSNNFLEHKIDSYITKKRTNTNITHVEDSYYTDL